MLYPPVFEVNDFLFQLFSNFNKFRSYILSWEENSNIKHRKKNKKQIEKSLCDITGKINKKSNRKI